MEIKADVPKASDADRTRANAPLDPEVLDSGEELFVRAWQRLLEALDLRTAQRTELRRLSQEATLWTALSAEGRINAFLSGMLDVSDLKALDRLSPPDKYALGPRIALGENLFPRDREPGATLQGLTTTRNRLAHPKPMSVDKLGADAPWDEPLLISFNTVTAARAVLAVAAATCSLADVAPKLELAVDVERAVASRRVKLTELAHRRMELGNAEYPAFKLEVSDLEFAVVNDSFM